MIDSWNDADLFERCYWRRVAVLIVLGICAAIVLVTATYAAPPSVLGTANIGKGGTIALYDSACGSPVQGLIDQALRPEYRAGWRRADGVFFMTDSATLKPFAGCWMEPPLDMTGAERSVLLIFEDGDSMVIPRAVFDGRPAPKPHGISI